MKKNTSSALVQHEDFAFEVDNLIPNNKIKAHPRFNKFIAMARSMSESSMFERYRIGAILVIKGKVVARGYNSNKGHPMQKIYNAERTDVGDSSPHPIHAELDVLRKAKNLGIDFKNAELFVYHINNNGEQKLARPCAACMKAIKDHGITVIHYSTPDGLATEYIHPSQKILVNKGRSPI